MKSQILLKHPGTFDQYPYARYAYECITQYFQANGGQIVLVPSGKFTPMSDDEPKLWVIDTPVSKGFTGKWWHMVRLPRLLRKIDAELIIQLGWDFPVLPKTKAKKWLIIPEIPELPLTDKSSRKGLMRQQLFFNHLQGVQRSFIYAPVAKKAIQEMKRSTTTPLSTASINNMQVWIPYPQNKHGVLTWEEKENFKELHTSGNEYFLIDAASANQARIIHYLKAFSHFKKWQKSAMNLVLLLSDTQMENMELNALLSSFHFREDVEFISAADRELRYGFFAAAYAVIDPSDHAGNLVHLLEAVQYGSLAVALASESATELMGSALFALPGTGFEEIGQTMITVYKSEILRSRHIKASETLAKEFQPKDWSYWLEKSAPVQ